MQTVEIKKQQMKYNCIFSKKCWFSRVLTFADLFTKLVKTRFAKASKYRENKNFKNRERKGAKPQYNFLKVLDLHVRKRFNSQIVKS